MARGPRLGIEGARVWDMGLRTEVTGATRVSANLLQFGIS